MPTRVLATAMAGHSSATMPKHAGNAARLGPLAALLLLTLSAILPSLLLAQDSLLSREGSASQGGSSRQATC